MTRPFLPSSLLLGNFVVGASVLAPAGMLPELARGFDVSVRDAGLFITFGAVVMCFGSPLLSWSTSRMDRRLLLGGSLLIVAICNLASAFATSYAQLLILRLCMLAAAAPFTPQAASVVGALAPLEKRASTVAFVFLGWSLAAAAGIPLVTSLASRYGWQWPYAAIGVFGLLSFVLLIWGLPAGVRTVPVELRTWGDLAQNGAVLRLLLLTVLLTAGQFVVYTFIGPLLTRLAHAGSAAIGVVFSLFGVAGLIGNLAATQIVRVRGPYQTSLFAVSAMATGVVLWSLVAGSLPLMVLAVGIWGLGFASSNSMQQARLIAAAPPAAAASVALNTSAIYVGQALGSAVGGLLFAREHPMAMGYCAAAFILSGLALLVSTRPHEAPAFSEPRAAV